MNFWGLLFLIITQFIAGRGILALLKIKLNPVQTFAVSMLSGVLTFSLIPMIIQLFYVPITKTNVFISLCVTSAVLGLVPIKNYDFKALKPGNIKFSMPYLYELLFMGLLVALIIPSAWRCFYFPVNARDVLSGPEALAEYAIKEHSISNSVFSVNLLESVPNLLKPPFVTDLQIIYKLFVHPFGSTWLIIVVISFLTFLYSILRERVHPVLTGFLMLFFMSIPEVYGYTYIVLWDYSNMIFFFLGIYFIYRYYDTKQFNIFLFCCLMFGFSTFIRLETIVFIGLIVPLMAFIMWKEKKTIPQIILNAALITGIPFMFYVVWVEIFVKYYLPLDLHVGTQIDFTPLTSYSEWIGRINAELVFGGLNIGLYGIFIYTFLAVLLIDAIFFRTFNKQAKFMLYCIGIIYFGLPILAYITPWFNITTAKRGLFKMFPSMILYMANSAMVMRLSQAIKKFEFPEVTQKNKVPKPATVHTVSTTGKKKKKKK